MGSAGLLMLTVASGASAQEPAASSWDAIVQCAAMAADDARHACYDDVMRRAGYLARPEAIAAEHRKRFGVELPKFSLPKPRHEASEAAASSGAAAAPGRSAPVEDNPDQITVVIEKVTLRDDGRLELLTTEGAVWRQKDSDAVEPRPKVGQSMVISRTVLGGYFCSVVNWRKFYCERDVRSAR